MDNENKFPEQDAPVKNTDNAYVKVGKDGAPELPAEMKTENDTAKEDEANKTKVDRKE